MVVRLANAEPVPVMTGSSELDQNGALRQVRLFPDPVEDGEHLLPAKLPVCVTGAADHVRDGLNGHMASFQETEVPEGTIGPLQQRFELVRINVGCPVDVNRQIRGDRAVLCSL